MKTQPTKKTPPTIRSFTDLKVWQEGHALVLGVYKTTRGFPKEEIYSLVDQMRRAATSVISNIAEGFGRNTYKEKLVFDFHAQGSLTELKNQLLIARDVGYLDKDKFSQLAERENSTHRLLQGLITKSKTFVPRTS